MARHQTGDKPLSEPMTAYSNEACESLDHYLTHSGLVTPCGDTSILINIASGNGLSPDGTPLLAITWTSVD